MALKIYFLFIMLYKLTSLFSYLIDEWDNLDEYIGGNLSVRAFTRGLVTLTWVGGNFTPPVGFPLRTKKQ